MTCRRRDHASAGVLKDIPTSSARGAVTSTSSQQMAGTAAPSCQSAWTWRSTRAHKAALTVGRLGERRLCTQWGGQAPG